MISDPDPKWGRAMASGYQGYLEEGIEKGGKGVSEEDGKEKGGSDNWSAEQWHEVKKGDTLSKISERYYGDGSLYMKIFEANRNILKDPNLIKVGQKLRIP